MLDDVPQIDELDDLLADLPSPTSLDVYEIILKFENDQVAASIGAAALNAALGGVPTGAAGGVLNGTYPNPSFAADLATQVELDAHVNDTTAAHAATTISADSTTLAGTGTTVQAVLEELDDAVAATQPVDSDLTAIAALTTTSFGRGLLELANQAALLSSAGAAAAAHAHSGADITTGTVVDARIDAAIARDSEVTSAISALSSVYQPLDSDLTAVAALTTTSFGRAVLALADAAALRTAAGTVIGTDVPALSATVLKSLYDANTVLAATTDDTPAAVTMGASTILARLAAGNIKAATVAEIATLLAPAMPGYRWDYAQITTTATTTVTTEASAVTLISGASVTYDGTPVRIRFFCPKVSNSTNAAQVFINIWYDSTNLGRTAILAWATATGSALVGEVVHTPSAAAHTYTARMWVDGGTGSATCGAGGAGVQVPCFMEVRKV